MNRPDYFANCDLPYIPVRGFSKPPERKLPGRANLLVSRHFTLYVVFPKHALFLPGAEAPVASPGLYSGERQEKTHVDLLRQLKLGTCLAS